MIVYQGMMFSNWAQACKKMGVRDSSFRYYTNKKGMPKPEALTHLFLVASGIKKSKPSIFIEDKEFESKKAACDFFEVCRTVVSNDMTKFQLTFEQAMKRAISKKRHTVLKPKSSIYAPKNTGIDYFLYKHPPVL